MSWCVSGSGKMVGGESRWQWWDGKRRWQAFVVGRQECRLTSGESLHANGTDVVRSYQARIWLAVNS